MDKQLPHYLEVVDCQYACPTHTPVPVYIRQLNEGKYNEAYLTNRESNVFPGVLGRICDRPCEPACRKGRISKEPVAICRLKRAAYDLKDDGIDPHLPKPPNKKNGFKIALIGAGPASLTVANDLLPLGYDLTLFEKEPKAGGSIRSGVPAFRLPQTVLDEELEVILKHINCFFDHPINNLNDLLPKYDAIFVGVGAPIGKALPVKGWQKHPSLHTGFEFLKNVQYEHLKTVKGHVIVIGGGNTAIDCARTSLRLGATSVEIISPESLSEMTALPWELSDAQHEGIQIRNNLLPIEILDHQHQPKIVFQHVKQLYDNKQQWNPQLEPNKQTALNFDSLIAAIGQETQFDFLETASLKRTKQNQVLVNQESLASSQPHVFFGGDCAFGPKNMITAVAHGHKAALHIDGYLQKKTIATSTMQLKSTRINLNQWSYENSYSPAARQKMPEQPLKKRLKNSQLEVEKGFKLDELLKETKRCLNCDIQTTFTKDLCIQCDACVDICPVQCLSIESKESEKTSPLPFAEKIPSGLLMNKDENICIHCGLCAERCPTDAWDMKLSTFNFPRPDKS